MRELHFDVPRRRVFTIICGMTVIILIIYGILNILFLNFFAGIVELVLSFSLLLSLFLILKKHIYGISIFLYVIPTIIISYYLFKTGGFHNSGIFWFFIFPLTYFLFLGSFRGLLSYLALIGGAAVIAFLSLGGYITLPYSKKMILFFFVISLLEGALLYIYQRILEQHLEHIFLLEGLMPICSSCKKIRDEEGAWEPMDHYLYKHTDIEFTHGLCPDCASRLYPGYINKKGKT